MDLSSLLQNLSHGDLPRLIQTVGLIGVAVIIFAESGLLIGFFLPGDSLLFTAGFLASQGIFPIGVLVFLTFVAAVAGDSVGYSFGYRLGRRLYQRPVSRFFRQKDLLRAEAFYQKHGGKAIILARFLPIVRTFAPIVAGTAAMPYRRFLAYNVVGAFLWAVCIPLAGYWLGSLIPDVDKYLIPIILAIIILSVLPTVYHAISARREATAEARRDGEQREAPAPARRGVDG